MLAAQLAVSRTTVVLVYDQLVAEGYAEARQGAGRSSRGRSQTRRWWPPADRTCWVGAGTAVRSRRGPDDDGIDRSRDLAARPGWRRSLALGLGRPDGRRPPAGLGLGWPRRRAVRRAPIRFPPGRPDWDTFPRQVWGRLTSRQVRERSEELASYGDPAGYRPLREAVATHLGQTRGVRCTAEQVVVVNGSQQGADLLIRLFLDPGDHAALEDPGYAGAALTLRAHGMTVLPGARSTRTAWTSPRCRPLTIRRRPGWST